MSVRPRIPSPDAVYLTPAEACGLLGVCYSTFKLKILPNLGGFKLNLTLRGVRIPRAEIERLAQQPMDEARAKAREMMKG